MGRGLLPIRGAAVPGVRLRRRAVVLVILLCLVLAGSLALLGVLSSLYPTLLSPGLLALTFGLRHALDVDHIAAIDNVTRKLVGEGQQPLLVGFFFSLGHASVVCIMCVMLAWSSGYYASSLPLFIEYGSIVGTVVSTFVLLVFGVYNLTTAISIYRAWRFARSASARVTDVPNGEPRSAHTMHGHDGQAKHTHSHPIALVAHPAGPDGERARVEGVGCLIHAPCCRALFRSIDRPWKLFPVGFLFGLGFDTATEVSMLALAVTLPAANNGVPWAATLILPLLFTAAMCLLDTLDGILMLWSYGWSTVDRALQLWFSLTLTATSAVIALAVGVVQALALLQKELDLDGPGWAPIAQMGVHSTELGIAVVCFFVVALAGAALYARRDYKSRVAAPPASGANSEPPRQLEAVAAV